MTAARRSASIVIADNDDGTQSATLTFEPGGADELSPAHAAALALFDVLAATYGTGRRAIVTRRRSDGKTQASTPLPEPTAWILKTDQGNALHDGTKPPYPEAAENGWRPLYATRAERQA